MVEMPLMGYQREVLKFQQKEDKVVRNHVRTVTGDPRVYHHTNLM
jgi:hypothetical protein